MSAAAAEHDTAGRLGEAAEWQARTERVDGFNASHGIPPTPHQSVNARGDIVTMGLPSSNRRDVAPPDSGIEVKAFTQCR
jgi:hypothetical protein